MQQPSALYDPNKSATPSQRLAAAAHRERRAKIEERAKAAVKQLDEVVSEVIKESEWIERQHEINPIPRAPWFSIECEIDPPEPRRPKIEAIQRAVAKYYGLKRDDLICARRTGNLILPRHIAMKLCRDLTLHSFPEIGRRFGNRDHTVPLYACRKVDEIVKSDPAVAADVAAITSRLVSE